MPAGSTQADSKDRRAVWAGGSTAVGRLTTLQVAVGTLCTLLGALMLVAPHLFSGPVYVALQGYLSWVGGLWLLSGIAVIGSAIAAVPPFWLLAAHFFAQGTLCVFLDNAVMLGAWPAVVNYMLLALGTALAPFTTHWQRARGYPRRAFFGLLFGTISVAYGASMFLLPSAYAAPVYSALRQNLMLHGAAILVAGAALAFAQLRPLAAPYHRAAHLAIVVVYLPYFLAVSLPQASWSGALFYGVFSWFVATLPRSRPRLRSVDPRSLAVRPAIALAVCAALPLVAITGALTGK